jgi:hypothetical protein
MGFLLNLCPGFSKLDFILLGLEVNGYPYGILEPLVVQGRFIVDVFSDEG